MTLPLPTLNQTSSPQQTVYNDSQQLRSRKRQRSLSMQSNASSPKRAVSEDPSSLSARDNRVEITTDSSTDPDILMRDVTPPISSLDPSNIDSICNRPLQLGESWYIISKRWLERWKKACTGESDKVDGIILESDLGPPDLHNPLLVDRNNHLLNTELPIDFVPQEVWNYFTSCYGAPTLPLPRKVIAQGVSNQLMIELHPPLLYVVRVVEQSTSDPGPSIPPIAVSAGATLIELSEALASPFNMNDTPHRIWTEVRPETSTLYPRHKLIEDRAQLLKESNETVGKQMIESGDVFAVEFLENGKWLVDTDKMGSGAMELFSGRAISPPPPLFSSGNDFFLSLESKLAMGPQNAGPNKKTLAAKTAKTFGEMSSSSRGDREHGTLGLGNMGNTCFMNSALQCLAHTKELCQYFVSGVYESELNPDNPLGMHGAIAQAFGALLRRIWCTNLSSYIPREFKQQLQRFAPQFIGYQQHDSQELVAFLLDGLHEDLNRIIKKPYVEKPDWEEGGDRELIELARVSWEGYLKRNDSVIVDLFQGQYKSTLVCPECQKVSITFDPFMYLTLPLPIQKKWIHSVYYVPWDTQKPVLRIPVEISRDATFKDLRKLLSRWMGSPVDNLLTAEVFQHRFYKNLDDSVTCSDMTDSDIVVCFELPCNSQQSQNYKRSPEDPFIVPVYLGEQTQSMKPTTYGQPITYGRGSPSYFGYPFVAVIDQEAAKNQDKIYSAVVERLEQWTKNSPQLYKWESGSPSPSDSIMEEVPIPITTFVPMDTVTEIKENGEIVMLQETPQEGDITDEKDLVVQEEDSLSQAVELRKLGPKPDIFVLRINNAISPFASGFHNQNRYELWENREQAAISKQGITSRGPLLRDGDVFVCEFDQHMKDFFFPDLAVTDITFWNAIQEFLHPEYVESKKTESARSSRGITLQDCLDEFTKEEKLGEDDLWYCPRCKKHQQATKRFDLWKLPDILVVHLKRFSNSRTLRDKIDTFVDFPIEGLDLENMVGERITAKTLMGLGEDPAALGLGNVNEPLVYDLYAVDEHLGGLGGGHYRAFALNHANNKWYHFDDSYVSECQAKAAINSNAYLLFYKRRTTRPLGGKTYEKIRAAGVNVNVPLRDAESEVTNEVVENFRYPSASPSPNLPSFGPLPASPNISSRPSSVRNKSMSDLLHDSPQQPWSPSTSSSSPPALDDEYTGFDDLHVDPLAAASELYDFPNPNLNIPKKGSRSPTGSEDIFGLHSPPMNDYLFFNRTEREPFDSSTGSTRSSSDDNPSPFNDENALESIQNSVVERSIEESTLNEIDL